ncbi:MAG TPA: hypothetical protein V6C76_11270 [Drouetiella sp.]
MKFSPNNILFLILVGLFTCNIASAAGKADADTESIKPKIGDPGVVESVDANAAEGDGSSLAAGYKLRTSTRVDRVLAQSRKAVKVHPDDMEAHRLLAEALESKVASLATPDPYVFQECIQEWLVIYRSEVGEEKGLGFRGVGVAGHLFEDDEYAIAAKHRLVHLVGRAPKPWETDSHYIKSALKNIAVVGKILRAEE